MKEKELFDLVKEIELLKSANNLLEWDMQTGMPEESSGFRGEQVGVISELIFDRINGEKMAELLEYFEAHPEEVSDLGKKLLRFLKVSIGRVKAIPKAEYLAYQKETTSAFQNWLEARMAKDFQVFLPSLERLIAMKKSFIPLWRQDEATPYDVLLNQFEPGMTTESLDKVFHDLKVGIKEIQHVLQTKGTAPDASFIHRPIPIEIQKKFSKQVATELGFDFNRGRLDESVHPFMEGLNSKDTRLTARWAEDDFLMGVFGVLHEQGHGQYEQNVSPAFDYTPLGNSMSMGLHESQSLFQEIMIGSNRAFWKRQFPIFNQMTSGVFKDIDEFDFFKGIKQTSSSLIRIEADTLTYCLHIIIRYEIEKAIFNEDYPVAELPKLWAELYEEYLGISPKNDLEGILQDVHWTSDFGYFPSYALGYMYAAQMKHAMNRDLDFEKALETGDYPRIKRWLDTHVRQYGVTKTPTEILQSSTGEKLNPDYLLDELKNLYYDVYQV
ncbi:MAG: carboxypeptidase M32 [Streptococcaceae bacterium]|jgi:carboxypeptidase Taq|nr:carboxypeptidase M32 [Streptococcaceae bacterium]